MKIKAMILKSEGSDKIYVHCSLGDGFPSLSSRDYDDTENIQKWFGNTVDLLNKIGGQDD